MADERFLVIKLSSLGDIVLTLPAVAALRDSFPHAQIDWVVEGKWSALLEGNPDINGVIALNRGSWGDVRACVRRLRAARYSCSIDFQGLYKSALLGYFSGARRGVGFDWRYAREGGAALFYTERASPAGRHMVEQNLALAERAGARRAAGPFRLRVSAEAQAAMDRQLEAMGVREVFVLSPGGGWRGKCWPPERYGELCGELARRLGWRGVVNVGPGERELAEAVCRAAAPEKPVVLETDVPELMALLRRARIVIAGDTGPLHLAVALGTPVVGLYGPTDPKRNGPYCDEDVVVRNARPQETTYKRANKYSASMLSITVAQVLAAIEQRLARVRAAARRGSGGPRARRLVSPDDLMAAAGQFWVRWRVGLGYPVALACFWLARPEPGWLAVGAGIAAVGLIWRGAAAGHLRKHEQLSTSGPYALSRNPLYFGSALLALGFVVACRSWLVGAVLTGYFALFYPLVMRHEEQELRARYGAAFEDYAARVLLFWPRLRLAAGSRAGAGAHFSWELYLRNREYQAALGVLGVVALLWLRMRLHR